MLAISFEKPAWAISPEKLNNGVSYIDGPYKFESPDGLKELSYQVFDDTYHTDENTSKPCVTTKYSLNSLLKAATMTAAPSYLHHNADAVEPIFEVVSHAFADDTPPVTYIRYSYIAEKRNGDPFLFKTSIIHSDGTVWSEGPSHGENIFHEPAKLAGHFSASEETRHIDFASTVQSFLAQFCGSGLQRFDRPQFILPQAK